MTSLRMRHRRAWCVALGLLGSPFGLRGQVLPAEVIIITPLPDSADNRSHTSIPADDRTHAPRPLTDLLAAVPGVQIRRSSDAGHASQISIRGSSAEQVVVLLDGIPLNTPATPVADLSLIPAAGIDRIDILRGGLTAAYGLDAMGGVINIVTKIPDAPHTIAGHVSGGAFRTTQADAIWTFAAPRSTWMAGGSHWYSAGDYPFRGSATNLAGTALATPGTFTREQNRSLTEALLLRGSVALDDHVTLQLLNNFAYADRELPGLEIETTQLAPLNPLEARERGYHNTSALRIQAAALADRDWQITGGVQNQFSRTHFADPSPALGAAIDRRTTYDTINPYVVSTLRQAAHLHEHTLTGRLDFRREIVSDRALNATTTAIGTHERDVWSAALQDRLSLWDRRLVIDPMIRVTNTRSVGVSPNYHLGVAGKVTSSLLLRGNIENVDRAPSFRELFHPDEGFVRGNPDLARERAWRWDAGATWEQSIVTASANYFEQHIRNAILFVPISATTIMPINTLAARTQGVEAQVTLAPTAWLNATASYTWLRSRFAGQTAQLPGRPEHLLAGSLVLQHKWSSRWNTALTTDVRRTGATPVNVANTVWIAARTTVDAAARVTWKRRDGREYFAAASGTNLGDVATYDARGFPLPGRAWMLSIGGTWSTGKSGEGS